MQYESIHVAPYQGCRFYELYESNDKGLFYFHEEWESKNALDRRTKTPHRRKIFTICSKAL
jgi:quinol monooxygenase YgiN